jgi:YbbR domain-containing protein
MKYKKGFSYIQKKSSRAFVIALLVSFFIWVLINLSKTYEKSVGVNVLYENVSEGNLVKSTDSVIYIKIQGPGFSLLNNELEKLHYSIDTQKYRNQWKWGVNDYQFKTLFPKSIKVLDVVPKQLNFEVITLAKKKVPVKPQIRVQTKLGYGITKSNLSINSILIYGESSVINKISEIETDSLNFDNVFESISGEVLLKNKYDDVILEQPSVHYTYDVERFTQGTFQLTIQIINVPKEKKISIFPKQVSVQFQSPLSLFSSYREEGFGVYVDYNDINNSNTLPIQMEYTPEGVRNAKVLKKSVTYLLIE